MDISVLKSQILEKKLNPVYLFIGDELALQDIYVDKIVEVSGYKKVIIDSLVEVYRKFSAKTLFKVEPKVYVIRNDEPYLKNVDIWEKVISGKGLKGNIIIFKYSNIDKRGKFYKTHEQIATEFNYVGVSMLKNRIQAITKLPLNYCEQLVQFCGCNYGHILHTIENIKMLSEINGYNIITAYNEAYKSKLIHEEIGDIIFEFTNAIVERNIVKAYDLYEKIKQTDEGPIKLLSVLYSSFRNIMIVQSTSKSQRTEEVLGLTKGQIYVTSQKCDRYNIFEVVKIVKLIQKIESGIKTGLIDQNYAIEYLMGEIW